MFEAIPSSELSSRTRKCRRLPNMTSRRTSSDQRSPITSTAALMGQPERGSLAVRVAMPRIVISVCHHLG